MGSHVEPYGYLKGTDADAGDSQNHLGDCETCREHVEETRQVLSLLHTLSEIEPSRDVWSKIESQVLETVPTASARPAVRRAGAFRFAWATAAAAALLVGIVLFTMQVSRPVDRLAATVSEVAPGSDAIPGMRLNVGDTFHTPTFATLTLPDAGTLKLNRNTTIRFDEKRRVTLLQGEVFAEITPNGKGFQVVSGDSTVTVHGTKFGVRSLEAVYVVEGKVTVDGPKGKLALGRGESGTLGPERLPLDALQAYLRWLHSMERPTLSLRIRPRGSAIVAPGSPAEWDLVFSSDAPILVDHPRSYKNLLLLLVKNPSGNAFTVALDASKPLMMKGPADANGKVLLDVDKEVVLTYRIEAGSFPEKGLYDVSVVYFARDTRVEAVESEPVRIEVRM